MQTQEKILVRIEKDDRGNYKLTSNNLLDCYTDIELERMIINVEGIQCIELTVDRDEYGRVRSLLFPKVSGN